MKLVTQFSSLADAESASILLERSGIATFISSRRSVFVRGILRVGLWVLLDRQLDDAVMLLENPEHAVTEPLSDAELNHLKSSIHANGLAPVFRHLLPLIVCLAVFVLSVAVLVYG